MTSAIATVRAIVTIGEADRISSMTSAPIWNGHVFEVEGSTPTEQDPNPEFSILLDGKATGESVTWREMPNTLRFAVCNAEQFPGYYNQ